jgi:hypothetical protein
MGDCMGLLLGSLLLFFFLDHIPAHAVTIVDVSEVSTLLRKDYISDCEWKEIIETRTTMTYRASVFVDPKPVGLPDYTYDPDSGFSQIISHPAIPRCFPDPENKDAIIPEYCTAELPLFAEHGGSGIEGGGSGLTLAFREWSEVSIRYNTVLHNNCKICDPSDPISGPIQTPTPEPQSWIFGVTGLVGILLSQRRSRKK